MKVEGHIKQPWWQFPPNYGCLLCPAGLWESRFWTEMLRNSFFIKTQSVPNLLYSAHETPLVTCMQGMLSAPSWVENIWNQILTCPHLFQKLNVIMEIIKLKKIPKCLLFLLNPLLPLEEASVDFCSPSIELQFLIHYSSSAKMVTQVKSSLAFCLLGLFLCINMCFDSVSLRKPPSLLRWVSCPHRSFLGVAALGDVAARIYMGFSWEGWCVGVFFAA